jgi:FkbM family methyltransferase
MQSWLKKLLLPLRPVVLALRYGRQRWQPRASYADDFEDVAAALLLGGVKQFVDVGANDGLSCSNTALAALAGARGLCFEPNPAEFQRLRGFYRLASRVECIPEGLSDRAGTVELRCDGLLSAVTGTEDAGLTNLLAEHRSREDVVVSVRVDRLSAWLDRRPGFAASDLLSLDVEGHELSVLQGIDWTRHPKPARCFIVETHAGSETRQWRHRDFDQIASVLAGHGYRKLAASRNNTFWIHRDDLVDSRLAAAESRLPHYEWFPAPPLAS